MTSSQRLREYEQLVREFYQRKKTRKTDWIPLEIRSKDTLTVAFGLKTTSTKIVLAKIFWMDTTLDFTEDFFSTKNLLHVLIAQSYQDGGTGQIEFVDYDMPSPIKIFIKETIGEDILDLEVNTNGNPVLTPHDTKILYLTLQGFLPEVINAIMHFDMTGRILAQDICQLVATGVFSLLEMEMILQSGTLPERVVYGHLDFESFGSLASLTTCIKAQLTQYWVTSMATKPLQKGEKLMSYDEPVMPLVSWYDPGFDMVCAYHAEDSTWGDFWSQEDLVLIQSVSMLTAETVSSATKDLLAAQSDLGRTIQNDRRSYAGKIHLVIVSPESDLSDLEDIKIPKGIRIETTHNMPITEFMGNCLEKILPRSRDLSFTQPEDLSGAVLMIGYSEISHDHEFWECWKIFQEQLNTYRVKTFYDKVRMLPKVMRLASGTRESLRTHPHCTSLIVDWKDVECLSGISQFQFGVCSTDAMTGVSIKASGKKSRFRDISQLIQSSQAIALYPLDTQVNRPSKRWFWEVEPEPLDQFGQVDQRLFYEHLPKQTLIPAGIKGEDLLMKQLTQSVDSQKPLFLNFSHTVVISAFREFCYQLEATPIRIMFSDQSEMQQLFPVRTGLRATHPPDITGWPVLERALISIRHSAELDGIRYLTQNRIVSQRGVPSSQIEQHGFEQMTDFLSTIQEPSVINLYHTGLEPLVVGVYRALLTFLNQGSIPVVVNPIIFKGSSRKTRSKTELPWF